MAALKATAQQREAEADDLKALHASKVDGLRSSLALEHRGQMEAARRAEVLAVQLEGRDAAAAAAKEAHQREAMQREDKVRGGGLGRRDWVEERRGSMPVRRAHANLLRILASPSTRPNQPFQP